MNKEEIDRIYRAPATEALRLFGHRAQSMDLVSCSENVIYRVRLEAGELFALRLHRPGYCSLEELESEPLWLEAIHEIGVSAPQPIMSCDGSVYVEVPIPTIHERRFASINTWQSGVLLSQKFSTETGRRSKERAFAQIGQIVAKMHNLAANWDVPDGFHRRALDSDGLLGEEPVWGRFWDHKTLTTNQARVLSEVRTALYAKLSGLARDRNRFGIIHADLHERNILEDDGSYSIIDFDDLALGWYLFDLATILFSDRKRRAFSQIRGALLNSYDKVRSVSRDDEILLDLFILIRGLQIIGWYQRRPDYVSSPDYQKLLSVMYSDCLNLSDVC